MLRLTRWNCAKWRLVSLSLASFSLLSLVTGCVHAPPAPSNQKIQALSQQHLRKIAQIKQFTLKGRIGLQASGKGFSGQLEWQHQPERDHLVFYSPLGSQIAVIEKTATQVTLTDAKGNIQSADDLQTLTKTALGWSLPLEGLADWSLGRPSNANIQLSTWDENGRLIKLKQDNWDIDYQTYLDTQGFVLPNRLTLRREEVYLKLIIDSWMMEQP